MKESFLTIDTWQNKDSTNYDGLSIFVHKKIKFANGYSTSNQNERYLNASSDLNAEQVLRSRVDPEG